MNAVAYLFWALALAAVVLIFRWLWKLADRIEKEEIEQRQWQDYIAQLWTYDPYTAQYYQMQYEARWGKLEWR